MHHYYDYDCDYFCFFSIRYDLDAILNVLLLLYLNQNVYHLDNVHRHLMQAFVTHITQMKLQVWLENNSTIMELRLSFILFNLVIK